MKAALSISVVVPIYRSEGIVDELARRLTEVLEAQEGSWEVLLVDDRSPDGVWKKMVAIHERDPRFRVARLARNFGQHNATLAGLSLSRGETVVMMDDDLQTDPADIPKLLKKLAEGYDVVMAGYPEKQHAGYRNLGSRLVGRLNSRLLKKDPELQLTSFRAIRRRTVQELLRMHTAFPILGPMLLSVTSNMTNVDVEHQQRHSGRSGYSLNRSFRLAMRLVLGYSALPLTTIGAVGILISILSFLFGLTQVVLQVGKGNPVPGWTTLVVLTSVLGGLNLLAMSIVGIYLSRLMTESISRPCFVIGEAHGGPDAETEDGRQSA